MAKALKFYYALDLPVLLKETLIPFKYELEAEEQESGDEATDDESSSEDELAQEPLNDPQIRSRESTPAATDIAPAASHQTQYNDEYEDTARWKLVNLAHISGRPHVYFTSSELPEGRVLAIYKALFDKTRLATDPLASLNELDPAGKSAVFLLGGGHFSGGIISHKRGNHHNTLSNPFANLQVLASKSFHRYTTRRKQGGGQSSYDNANGNAKSAGSNIRRQMEQQLRTEIQQLLLSWAPQLAECQRIFIRAAGQTNRATLFDFPNAPFGKDDTRVRSVPFTTKRATNEEVKRAWLLLTRAEVVNAPKLELKPEPAKPKIEKAQRMPEPLVATPEPEEPEVALTNKILQAIKKSQLPVLKDLLVGTGKPGIDFRLQPPAKHKSAPTALLYAARNDKHQVVGSLLTWGADPTIKANNVALGTVAKDSPRVRDALQVARKNLGERKWDWDAALIGPGMSREELLARDTAEKLKIQKATEEKLAREEKLAHASRIEQLIGKQASARHSNSNNTGMNDLSASDKQRIERERRARAAEARLARLGG